ncbi:phage protease [Shigella sonnei]
MKTHIAALAIAITKATHGTIQLFPAGEFRALDGRPHECDHWLMSADIAKPLIAAATQRKTPYVIDYEHQTLHSKNNGQPAPAAGFFNTLEWREGEGLFATDVEWTDKAAEMIAAREYLYISPVFQYDKFGHVLSLLHAALTNTPAVDGMDEAMLAAASLLAATSTTEVNTGMDELLERLRWMLNLPITATADDIIAELNKLIDQLTSSEAGTAAASFNTLSATPFNLVERLTNDASRIAALSAQVDSPDPERFVPVEVMTQSIAQAVSVALNNQAALSQQACDTLITAALSDGRLLPAQEPWAKALAKSNPDSLKSYLDKQPKIAALTQCQSGGQPPAGVTHTPPAASDTDGVFDPAICSLMGTDPTEVSQFMKENNV